jgi:hypothetical protein
MFTLSSPASHGPVVRDWGCTMQPNSRKPRWLIQAAADAVTVSEATHAIISVYLRAADDNTNLCSEDRVAGAASLDVGISPSSLPMTGDGLVSPSATRRAAAALGSSAVCSRR